MINYNLFTNEYKKHYEDLLPIVVMDIGGKGGIPHEFKKASEVFKFIMFEPNPAEYKKLNKENSNNNVLPYAIGAKEETKNLYVTNYSSGSSLYKINEKLVSRFWDHQNLVTNDIESIDCVSLNFLYKNNKISVPNFIKIDVEGGEFDVLSGSTSILSHESCLGLKIECRFDDWLLDDENKPVKTFSEIDIFLKEFGFKLYDIIPSKHGKKPLIQPYTNFNGTKKVPGPCNFGQTTACDAIFFKDVGTNYNNNKIDYKNSLKLAMLMDVYDQEDSVVEICNFLYENDDIFKNIMKFIKLNFNGKFMEYNKSQIFMRNSNENNDLKYWYRKQLSNQILQSLIKYVATYFPENIKSIIRNFIK